MRRRLRGHADAACLGAPDDLRGAPRAHVRHVHVPARQLREERVAGDHDRLGRVGNALHPEPRGGPALVHDAVPLEIGILGVLDDRHAQGAGQLERPAHDLRVPHRLSVVGDRDRARLDQLLDLGQGFAHLSAGHRGDGMDARVPALAGAPDHVFDPRAVVERRGGVRHAGDRGEAAPRRGAGSRLDRLLLFLPRLAQVHVDVHEPGTDHGALHRQHLGGTALADLGGRVLPQAGDLAVHDPEILHAVDAARGIEDPTAADAERARHGPSSSPSSLSSPSPEAAPPPTRRAPCAPRAGREPPSSPRRRSSPAPE